MSPTSSWYQSVSVRKCRRGPRPVTWVSGGSGCPVREHEPLWIRHTTLTWVERRGVASDATFCLWREADAVRASDSVPPRPHPIMDEKVHVRHVHEGEDAAGDSMCHRVLLHRKTV